MARTEFTAEEMRNRLFAEVVVLPQGTGITHFHGFYDEEALYRARTARQSWKNISHYHEQRGEPIPMSVHLFFIASLFAEIELQDAPMAGKRIANDELVLCKGCITPAVCKAVGECQA